MLKSVIVLGVLFAVAPAHATPAEACPPDRPPLLILGTFHMQGSTEDAVNVDPGDMTSARRQAEITELVRRLARFQPTKVAIESSRISRYWNERYTAWIEGTHALGTNEIEQIGFRVARTMNLLELSPVDYPMWMNGLMAIDRHDPRPAEAAPVVQEPAGLAAVRAQVDRDQQHLRDSTVSEHLAYLNDPVRARMNHQWDVISNLTPAPGVAMYETTDLATNWYKRNLRIYTNVVDITAPGDRVLLIVGAGHKYLLDSIARDDPRICLVDSVGYLQ